MDLSVLCFSTKAGSRLSACRKFCVVSKGSKICPLLCTEARVGQTGFDLFKESAGSCHRPMSTQIYRAGCRVWLTALKLNQRLLKPEFRQVAEVAFPYSELVLQFVESAAFPQLNVPTQLGVQGIVQCASEGRRVFSNPVSNS